MKPREIDLVSVSLRKSQIHLHTGRLALIVRPRLRDSKLTHTGKNSEMRDTHY